MLRSAFRIVVVVTLVLGIGGLEPLAPVLAATHGGEAGCACAAGPEHQCCQGCHERSGEVPPGMSELPEPEPEADTGGDASMPCHGDEAEPESEPEPEPERSDDPVVRCDCSGVGGGAALAPGLDRLFEGLCDGRAALGGSTRVTGDPALGPLSPPTGDVFHVPIAAR